MRILLALVLVMMIAGCATAPETYAPVPPTSTAICSPGLVETLWHPTGKEGFVWPVRGCIVSSFGDKIDRVRNKGVDIQAGEGSSVRASKAGKVVYCDSQLKGFGKTVILDHGNNFQTVYSYNEDILVEVGDVVEQNTVIARVGRTGRAKESSLHFEIRRNGEPQNPVYYLR